MTVSHDGVLLVLYVTVTCDRFMRRFRVAFSVAVSRDGYMQGFSVTVSCDGFTQRFNAVSVTVMHDGCM